MLKNILTTLTIALTITVFQIVPVMTQGQGALNPEQTSPFGGPTKSRSTQQGAGTSATSEAVKEFGSRAFNTTGAPRTPTDIAITTIKTILGLLGLITVILIIYAGFKWMTAAGEVEKVTSAKSLIINAVIGLVIVLSAYAITEFVASLILSATQKNPFA